MQTMPIVDGDGHIFEDNDAIVRYLPHPFEGVDDRRFAGRLFPPLDHLHAQPFKILPEAFGAGKPVGPTEWRSFMDFTGIRRAALYPTGGLASGNIINQDWAIAVCRAYNDWLYDTYTSQDPRFTGVALLPLQDPSAAVKELRRAVTELGFKAAMLPTNGLKSPIGAPEYWPIYEEAVSLDCALATHGGAHGSFGMDYLDPYAAVNALGHPVGQMISFASAVLNGLFDRFDGLRMAFLEAGVAWFLVMLERLERSYDTHIPYDAQGRYIRLRDGESVGEYIKRKIADGQIYVGCEGEEPALAYAVQQVGEEAFLFSSDFPHEVDPPGCKHEIEEVLETNELSQSAKEAVLFRNAERLYRLEPASTQELSGAGVAAGSAG